MSRYLVTGAAGFLGSHLCETLLNQGNEVVGADNLSTGLETNLSAFSDNNAFTFVNQDVTEPLSVDGNLDFVLHFASPASPPDYLAMPIETLRVGSVATEHLLQLATQKSARFLLASTSEVYGDPLEHPQKETYWGNVNSVGPRSVYDEAKRYAEAITMAYARSKGTDIRIVRIFNTYGPRMRAEDGRVVSNFIVQALKNSPLSVYGEGEQSRSFCFVDDEIRGILDVLQSDYKEPVNVGNPNEFTVGQLAEIILKVLNSESKIEYQPLPTDDPSRRRPDITLLRSLNGWEPTVELEEGIRRTAEYFRQQTAN